MAFFRTLILLGVLPGIVLTGFVGCNGTNSDPVKEVTGPLLPPERVSLKIDFGESRETVEFQTDLKEGMTVFDLLKAATDSKKVALDYSGAGETAFVKAIGGIVGGQAGNHWWLYYVNDEMAKIGSGVYELKDNDSITWQMGKYE